MNLAQQYKSLQQTSQLIQNELESLIGQFVNGSKELEQWVAGLATQGMDSKELWNQMSRDLNQLFKNATGTSSPLTQAQEQPSLQNLGSAFGRPPQFSQLPDSLQALLKMLEKMTEKMGENHVALDETRHAKSQVAMRFSFAYHVEIHSAGVDGQSLTVKNQMEFFLTSSEAHQQALKQWPDKADRIETKAQDLSQHQSTAPEVFMVVNRDTKEFLKNQDGTPTLYSKQEALDAASNLLEQSGNSQDWVSMPFKDVVQDLKISSETPTQATAIQKPELSESIKH